MTDLRQAAQQALEAMETCGEDEWHSEDDFGMVQTYDEDKVAKAITTIRTALEQQAEPMTEVADRFAHRMALELECVLSDGAYSNKWYKSAMQVLSEYRSAMNAIHEQHSPTFMGEPRV